MGLERLDSEPEFRGVREVGVEFLEAGAEPREGRGEFPKGGSGVREVGAEFPAARSQVVRVGRGGQIVGLRRSRRTT